MQITNAERDQLRERHGSLTEAELDQLIEAHRLIIDHLRVAKIVAFKCWRRYRNWKNLEFEDLWSEGLVGLVKAGRTWEGRAAFFSYAWGKARWEILEYIEQFRQFVPISGNELIVHLMLAAFNGADVPTGWRGLPGGILQEGWRKLPTTPERIKRRFETIRHSPHLKDAWRVLSKRERRMVKSFLGLLKRKRRLRLEEVAREERMSYRRAMLIVDRSVKELRDNIKFSQQKANVQFSTANYSEGKKETCAPFLPAVVHNRFAPLVSDDNP